MDEHIAEFINSIDFTQLYKIENKNIKKTYNYNIEKIKSKCKIDEDKKKIENPYYDNLIGYSNCVSANIELQKLRDNKLILDEYKTQYSKFIGEG
jgi:hypothetical protein